MVERCFSKTISDCESCKVSSKEESLLTLQKLNIKDVR